jgi:hypothetical protein
MLRIPLAIHNSTRGEKEFSTTEGALLSMLPMSSSGIPRLQDCRLIRLYEPKRERPPVEYDALAKLYREILCSGEFTSQAELARYLGVSRVWVCRLLKGIKRWAGC